MSAKGGALGGVLFGSIHSVVVQNDRRLTFHITTSLFHHHHHCDELHKKQPENACPVEHFIL